MLHESPRYFLRTKPCPVPMKFLGEMYRANAMGNDLCDNLRQSESCGRY
jgi:hypothetical protein